MTGLGGGVLPHVVFILGGQVTVMPQGESKTVNNGELKTTIPVIPDVPIGHFRLSLYGGRLGYLSNTQSLCSSPVTSTVEIDAQNGKSLDPAGQGEDRLPGQAQAKAPQGRQAPQARPALSTQARGSETLTQRRVSKISGVSKGVMRR